MLIINLSHSVLKDIISQFQVIGGISASPPVSASLPPLAPAPSLHQLHHYELHQPLQLQGQHHNHQHFSLLTPHLGRPFSTVYRNPYDVTGSRELADALRTQDDDQRVREHLGLSPHFICVCRTWGLTAVLCMGHCMDQDHQPCRLLSQIFIIFIILSK